MGPHERTAAAAERVRKTVEGERLSDIMEILRRVPGECHGFEPPQPNVFRCPNAPGPCNCTGACMRGGLPGPTIHYATC